MPDFKRHRFNISYLNQYWIFLRESRRKIFSNCYSKKIKIWRSCKNVTFYNDTNFKPIANCTFKNEIPQIFQFRFLKLLFWDYKIEKSSSCYFHLWQAKTFLHCSFPNVNYFLFFYQPQKDLSSITSGNPHLWSVLLPLVLFVKPTKCASQFKCQSSFRMLNQEFSTSFFQDKLASFETSSSRLCCSFRNWVQEYKKTPLNDFRFSNYSDSKFSKY